MERGCPGQKVYEIHAGAYHGQVRGGGPACVVREASFCLPSDGLGSERTASCSHQCCLAQRVSQSGPCWGLAVGLWG